MRKRQTKRLRFERLDPRTLLAFDSLVISEFMASNDSTLADEDGDFSDWLEIHNPTAGDLTLEGWSLTDDANVPSKWNLPAISIAAGGYQVVFASGKDRAAVDQELHTSFRLQADGEYLALVGPEGVTHEYRPEYPRQSSDVAFGLVVDQAQLIAPDASSRLRIPTPQDAALGTQWTRAEFDDSSWPEVNGTIGYELRKGIANVGFEDGDFNQWETNGEATVVAASIGTDPTQGDRHALVRSTQSAPTRFTLETFLGLDRFALDAVGDGEVTRGSALKRELDVEAGSQIEFDWNFLSDEPSRGGSNDFAFVSITPDIGIFQLADVSAIDRASGTPFARETGYETFRYTFEQSGTYTIGLGAVNVDNRFLDSGLLIDNLLVDGIGSLADTFGALIEQDVQADLSGAATSAWVRHEFDVADPSMFTAIVLSTRYDDGLVAYLNGQEVVRRNAPEGAVWNSLAIASRSDTLAFDRELITIPSGELRPGKNVFAIQGLKESIDDESFLLQFELVGIGELNDVPAYLPSPTPGGPNLTDSFRTVGEVQFSAEHGFYEDEFMLTLTSATPNATIIFTVDGSAPTLQNGMVYESPLTIDSGKVVRAAAFRDEFAASRITTRSYLFVDDVIGQSRRTALERGFPSEWGQSPADYDMDRRIVGQNGADRFGGRYANTVRDDLKSVPTLSLVMDMDDLFGLRGIYSNPIERGVEWERPTSVELIDPGGSDGFQIDAGIRIQGGISRFISSKSSLRLLFKESYGASKLEFPLFGPENASSFDSISLRSSSGEHLVGIHYIRDEFLRRSQLQTGNLSSHGTYMHLFINGLYWGMYNPVERIDGQFAANYFGGEKEDYDVLNAGDLGQEGVSAVIGSLDAWNTTLELSRDVSRARTEAERTSAYLRLQGRNPDGTDNDEWEVYLDVENFIDYLITNLYARNTDWPIRNYYMSRRLGPDSTGFQFYVWDAEFTLDRGQRESISQITSDGPGEIYQLLRNSKAFRVDFSDRVQKHFSPGGAYYVNPENRGYDRENPQDNVPAALYVEIANEVASPIVPESARWGDERGRGGPLFTRDEEWVPNVNLNLNTFFPDRSRDFQADLRRNGFFRDAPLFSIPTGSIEPGRVVRISATSGTVYYTLDGTDPRNPDGSISASAVAGNEVVIDERTTLRARSLDGEDWSAIDLANYFTDTLPADSTNLRISELSYNPHDPLTSFGELDVDNDEFEFIELANVGNRPVDLTGIQFVQRGGDGVAFTFGSQLLVPDGRLVVPKNRAAFASRFGDDVSLAIGTEDDASQWVFDGRLGNGGERITLVNALGENIVDLQYDDSAAWPGRADGKGSSLEVIDLLADTANPANYRSSSEFGGSPGAAGTGADNRVVINELLANSNRPAVDQIELVNTTARELDLSGWYLSDSSDDYRQFRIPDDVRIPARGYLVFDESEFGFGLSSVRGDDVYLLESRPDGKPSRFVDRVEFDATDAGISLGRWPNAEGRLFPMASASFGTANSGPLTPPIIVSEIHYEPEDPDDNGPLTEANVEYVELYNQTEAAIELDPYSVDGSVGFDFGPGTLLDPGASIVIVSFDPLADADRDTLFRLVYGIDAAVQLVGPFAGGLAGESGIVRVERETVDGEDDPDRSQVLVDRVAYENVAGWPSDLTGTGQSLSRGSPQTYGDFASSWTSLRRSPGSTKFTELSPGDMNGDGRVDAVDIEQLCSAIRGVSAADRFDLNRDGQIDHDDFELLISDILGVVPGDANLDGIFNSRDLVIIFKAAEYEDDLLGNSTWTEGDWNCDGEFNSSDIVVAFKAGGYSRFNAAPRIVAAVPVPFFDLEDEQPSLVNRAPTPTLGALPAAKERRHPVQNDSGLKRIFAGDPPPAGKARSLPILEVDRFFVDGEPEDP